MSTKDPFGPDVQRAESTLGVAFWTQLGAKQPNQKLSWPKLGLSLALGYVSALKSRTSLVLMESHLNPQNMYVC